VARQPGYQIFVSGYQELSDPLFNASTLRNRCLTQTYRHELLTRFQLILLQDLPSRFYSSLAPPNGQEPIQGGVTERFCFVHPVQCDQLGVYERQPLVRNYWTSWRIL